jgi:hypothetical protein
MFFFFFQIHIIDVMQGLCVDFGKVHACTLVKSTPLYPAKGADECTCSSKSTRGHLQRLVVDIAFHQGAGHAPGPAHPQPYAPNRKKKTKRR